MFNEYAGLCMHMSLMNMHEYQEVCTCLMNMQAYIINMYTGLMNRHTCLDVSTR